MTNVFDTVGLSLDARPPGCRIPLTAQQRRLWNDPVRRQGGWRFCVTSLRVLGHLSTPRLKSSIEALVHRHESLRTRLVGVDGIPEQRVDPGRTNGLEVIDLAKQAPRKIKIEIENDAKLLAREIIERKIDWSVGPQFDARVLRVSEREHILIVVMDHMLGDALSFEIINRELWTLYRQAVQGLPFSLPRLPIQFADYAVWQDQTYDGWRKNHETYWRQHLAGVRPIEIPVDDGLPPVDNLVRTKHLALGKLLTGELRDLAFRANARLPLLVLALYVVVMSRWCDRRDVFLTFISHGRHRPDLKGVAGYVTHILPFRVEANPKEGFVELLKRVNDEFHGALQHIDFERVPEIMPNCISDLFFDWVPSSPDFNFLASNCVCNWIPVASDADGQDWSDLPKLQPFPLRSHWHWDKFAPLFYENADGVNVHVTYRGDLLAEESLERFARNFRSLAAQVAQRPHDAVVLLQ